MNPRSETEAVAAGRKAGGGGQKAGSFRTGAMEKRVEVGKGGCEIGKWCSFSHYETALTRLFPHNSTQVVDFPHLMKVRLFLWEAENSRILVRGMIVRGMGPSGARNHYGEGEMI